MSAVPNLYAQAIQESEVFLGYIADGKKTGNIEKSRATSLAWGMLPRWIDDANGMTAWKQDIIGLQTKGLEVTGRVEFDAGWWSFVDFVGNPTASWALDLEGNPVDYWWFAGQQEDGYAANWISHHAPDFKAFLKHQVDKVYEAPIDRLLFDTQTSSTRTLRWEGGDFSIHALSGFRSFLKAKYSSSELKAMSVNDVDSFDYRVFLNARGYNTYKYQQEAETWPSPIPLYEDFVLFNRESLNDLMNEVFTYAKTKNGTQEFGVSASLAEPRGWVHSEEVQFLNGELFHSGDWADGTPYYPILDLKLAEALNKKLIFNALPADWESLKTNNRPRQARTWIAQAYAMGGNFLVPGDVWLGNSGTWDPGFENYQDLYTYIQNNKALFDNQKSHSKVGLLFSTQAQLYETPAIRDAVLYLIQENIPFDVLVFGDAAWNQNPSLEKLKQYEAILSTDDESFLTSEQKTLLNTVGAKKVLWKDKDGLSTKLSAEIKIQASDVNEDWRITAFPKKSVTGDKYTIQLVNRIYVANQDKPELHENIVVEIDENYFEGKLKKIIYHTPENDSKEIPIVLEGGVYKIPIGDFSLWGTLELLPDLNTTSKQRVNNEFSQIGDVLYWSFKAKKAQIYNSKGEQLLTITENHFDLSALPKGTYHLKITIGKQVSAKVLSVK